VGKGNVAVFFIFLEKPRHTERGAEEACWACPDARVLTLSFHEIVLLQKKV